MGKFAGSPQIGDWRLAISQSLHIPHWILWMTSSPLLSAASTFPVPSHLHHIYSPLYYRGHHFASTLEMSYSSWISQDDLVQFTMSPNDRRKRSWGSIGIRSDVFPDIYSNPDQLSLFTLYISFFPSCSKIPRDKKYLFLTPRKYILRYLQNPVSILIFISSGQFSVLFLYSQ